MDGEEGGQGEGEEGEISPMCGSIGHRPFRAAAQKALIKRYMVKALISKCLSLCSSFIDCDSASYPFIGFL